MKAYRKAFWLALAGLGVGLAVPGCQQSAPPNQTMHQTAEHVPMTKGTDPHSFARPDQVAITDLMLDIKVDFEKKTIGGKASYRIENKTGARELLLDTRDLDILKVTLDAREDETPFALGAEEPFLGRSLQVHITPQTRTVHIYYRTRPEAAALQWLSPEQTAGKQHPFLFTQSQAILARTWIPVQDGPGIRFTYSATVEVPKNLLPLMSATNPTRLSEDGKYRFVMDQPVPAYLLALTVGNLEFRPVGSRTGVYAEPQTLDAAAWEFDGMEDMLNAAEALYGPYRWERYDVVVLPPSFPFGGMENPRITFSTPTILAGDRSLVSLIAHELAHSWSGNLVTNATWNDFWLNEGFTVYFERRIMEALEGADYAEVLALLGYQDMLETIKEKGKDSPDTRLKLDLAGRDPDDAVSDIAYEKGFNLLRVMEAQAGRAKFDRWVREYFDSHAFQSMDTETFVEYVKATLFKGNEAALKRVKLEDWIYRPGLPANARVPKPQRFKKVEQQLAHWQKGRKPAALDTTGWSTHEWLHFVRHLPHDLSHEKMAELDKAFGFTNSGNSEIQAAWFEHVVRRQYKPAYAALEAFMVRVGRRKFILPLYKQMHTQESTRQMAHDIYQKARPNYHAVAVHSIDEVLEQE